MAVQFVAGVGPDADAVKLMYQCAKALDGNFVDRQQVISWLDARLVSRPSSHHLFRLDGLATFFPPDPIYRNRVLPFFLKIDGRKDDGSQREKAKNKG